MKVLFWLAKGLILPSKPIIKSKFSYCYIFIIIDFIKLNVWYSRNKTFSLHIEQILFGVKRNQLIAVLRNLPLTQDKIQILYYAVSKTACG